MRVLCVVLSSCRMCTPPRGSANAKTTPVDSCRLTNIALKKVSPYHAGDTRAQRCSKRTLLDLDSDDTVTGDTHHAHQQQRLNTISNLVIVPL